MTEALVAFGLVAALMTITPGLDTLLVLRASATGGRAAGVAAAIGISTGVIIWAAASAIGLTALLAASKLAYDVLCIAGAAYLCWLGARALWSVRRHATPVEDGAPTDVVVGEQWTIGRALRVGLTTNLLNPKVGAFYLSVLPQFLPTTVNPLGGSLALASVHVAEGLLWLSLLAFLVTRARGWLTRAAVRRRFEQATGVVLVALGLRLALDR